MTNAPYIFRYEDLSDGWVRASVANRPEIAAEAPTRSEAREMTLAALMGMLQSAGELKPVLPSSSLAS